MIDELYDLIGGRETIWAATESFYRRVFAKVCLSRCFSGDESCIRAKISMRLTRMCGSKG